MRRPPFLLTVASVLGAGLGLWMVIDGLHARLYGTFQLSVGTLGLWTTLLGRLGVDAASLAMTLVTLGLVWWGALGVLWTGLAWGPPATTVVALLSLLYLPVGTVLGLLVLICLSVPSVRAWQKAPMQGDGT